MIRSQTIEISKKNNITLAVLSDIHYHRNYHHKRLEQIYDNIAHHTPDYICIVGDLIDQGNVLEEKQIKNQFFEWITSLSMLAPVIISIGNHDITVEKPAIIHHESKELLKELAFIQNVYVLNQSSILFGNICFLGYNPPYTYYYQKPYEKVEPYCMDLDTQMQKHLHPECYQILLCHTPVYITHPSVKRSVVLQNVDLVLSGHMHNGLVPFPLRGNRGLISPFKKPFPKYARGYFQLDKTNVFISGGVIAFSNVSPKIFHPFNIFYPISISYLKI